MTTEAKIATGNINIKYDNAVNALTPTATHETGCTLYFHHITFFHIVTNFIPSVISDELLLTVFIITWVITFSTIYYGDSYCYRKVERCTILGVSYWHIKNPFSFYAVGV